MVLFWFLEFSLGFLFHKGIFFFIKASKFIWKSQGPSSISGSPNTCPKDQGIKCHVFLVNTVLLNRCGLPSLKVVFQLSKLFGFLVVGFF